MGRLRGLTAAAVALGVVPFVVHAWFALRGYFAHDDWVFLYDAMALGLTPEYLFQPYNGHLMPGGYGLVWLVTELAPLNFVVAMAPVLLMHAVTLVVLWRLLVRVFGPRWGLLVPFGVFACSPVVLTSSLWWAYALQLVPLMMATVLAVDAHMRYLGSGRARYLAGSVGWTLFGMAFYEKAALIGFLLFGFTVLLAARPKLLDAVRWSWRTFRRGWLAHGVLLLVYAASYVFLVDSPVRSQEIEAGSVPELAGRMVLDSLLVPSLGIPVAGVPKEGVAQLVSSHDLVRAAAILLVAAVVTIGCVVGRRRAALAWTLFGGYLAVDVALVMMTRLPLIGPMIGTDLRYIADAVLVMVLCGAFAYFRPVVPVLAAEEAAPAPARARRVPRVAIAMAVAAALIGATVTSVRAAPSMLFPTARQYVATAGQSAKGLVLYDAPVPDAMMIGWFDGQRMASRVLTLLPDPPRFDQPTEKIYLVDAHGKPRRIDDLSFEVAAEPGPITDCGYSVDDEPVVIPLAGDVKGRQLLHVGYFTASAGPVAITAGSLEVRTTLAEGVHDLYLTLDPADGDTTYDEVVIRRMTPVAAVCVDTVAVGQPG